MEIGSNSLEERKRQAVFSNHRPAKEVEKAESVRSCIEQLQQENRELLQVKKQELDL